MLTLAGLGIAPQAQAASAQVTDITCLGSSTENYSPPLTNTTQVVSTSFTESYSCTSLTTSVSSGNTSSARVGSQNCLLSGTPTGLEIITYVWNNQNASTVAFSDVNVVRAVNGTATVTSTGSVISGLGVGSNVVRVIVIPQLSLTACATTGVSSATGTATLSIL
ncbi:hypothetical protein ACFY8O_33915 [Streptomyces argenteolus]|uniref:Ig-like domain-containing protein n=1 Tax=Streptomyces argenteolus TaxID=67274 RepID=A0ABW6XGN7_9ACTN